jgi:dipeptidyl aminopeptidase/acylaminoacyl peptidase
MGNVPCEQYVLMAEQFRKFGVDPAFITIAGGEHGLAGGDPRETDQAYEQAFRFVHQQRAGR